MNTHRRRAAHYGKERGEEGSGKRIFFQTLICIAVIFYVLFGGTHELPIGQTVIGFTKETVSRNTDIGAWVDRLHGIVEKKIGSPKIPVTESSEKFTEKNEQKSADEETKDNIIN